MSIRPLQTTEETVPALAMEPGRCPPPQKAAAAAYPKGIAAAELLAAEADTSFGSTVKARARTRLQYVGNRPFLCATHEEKGLRARLRRQKAANPPVKWIVQDEGSPFNDPQGLRQSLSRPPLSSRPPAGPHDREKEERRRAKLLGLSSSYLPPTFLTEPVRAPSLDTSFSPMALSEHTNATAPTELSMLGSTTGSLASTLHRLPPLEGAPSDFLQFPDLPPVPMSASRDRPIPGSPMGSSHSQARPVPFTHHDDKGELMSHMDLLREERFRIREQRLQQQQYNLALHHHLLRTEQEVRALDRKKAKTHPAELARLWLTYKKEEAEQKESERAITQQIALSVSSDPMATLLCNREFNGRDPDAAEETPARAPSPGHRQPRRQKRGTSGVDRAVRPYLHSVGAPLARRVEKVVKATTAAKATSDPAAAPPHRSNKAPLRKKPKQQSEPPAQSEDIPALARRTFLECWARVGLAVPEDPAVLFAPPAPTAKARQDPRKVACAETLQRAVRRWIARRRTKQLHEARDLEEQRDIADELEDMMDDPKFVGLLDY